MVVANVMSQIAKAQHFVVQWMTSPKLLGVVGNRPTLIFLGVATTQMVETNGPVYPINGYAQPVVGKAFLCN